MPTEAKAETYPCGCPRDDDAALWKLYCKNLLGPNVGVVFHQCKTCKLILGAQPLMERPSPSLVIPN